MGHDIDRCIVTELSPQIGNTPLHHAVEGGHSEVMKQLLLFQANVGIENNVSSAIFSVSTITLYLMLMLEWNLTGHQIGQSVSGWVDVTASYCVGSMCQDYNNHNANGKVYCKRK